jgi:hypothetical protein
MQDLAMIFLLSLVPLLGTQVVLLNMEQTYQGRSWSTPLGLQTWMTDLGRNPEVHHPEEDLPQVENLKSTRIQESWIQLEGPTFLRTRTRVMTGEENQGPSTARPQVIKIKIPVITDIVLGHEPPTKEESVAEDRARAETEGTVRERLKIGSLDSHLKLRDLPPEVLLLSEGDVSLLAMPVEIEISPSGVRLNTTPGATQLACQPAYQKGDKSPGQSL